MEIIKHGIVKNKKVTKRFTCDYCGCVFEAEKGEYKATEGIAQSYNCQCPTCGYTVYGK